MLMLEATTTQLHRVLAERLQQHRRAQVIDAGVLGDLVHALADADQRDQVNHCVDAVERASEVSVSRISPTISSTSAGR